MLSFRRNRGGHRALTAAALLGAGALLYGACGSTAKGVDACRALESARCEKLASKDCNTADAPFAGDSASCARFYDTQCGRGLAEGAREPSAAELNRCIVAIKSTCAIARDPGGKNPDNGSVIAPECRVFLSPPEAPVTDTGAPADTTPADATDAATAD